MIVFDVLGSPAPKGSARAFYKAGMKRAVIVKDNDARQRGWDANVRHAAVEAVVALGDAAPTGPLYVDTPIAVELTFRMARPAGHWRKAGGLKPSAPIVPSVKPDADKLARSTLDSMTGLVFDDDSRIVELVVRKVYADPGREGARIMVRKFSEPWSLAIAQQIGSAA